MNINNTLKLDRVWFLNIKNPYWSSSGKIWIVILHSVSNII
jgi:hypothetical protein